MTGRFQGGLPERAFEFAAAVLDLVDRIPTGTKGWVVAKQLASSGTSVGANLHEADEAFSENEFVYRCTVARKEASETGFWLRLCVRSRLLVHEETVRSQQEALELVRILTVIIKKVEARNSKS